MPHRHDPLLILETLAVTVAWAGQMRESLRWYPDDDMLVLNADVPRRQLADDLIAFLPEIPKVDENDRPAW